MKKIYLLPLLMLGMSACVEDEGNYNLTELNDFTIEGVEDSYSVISGADALHINPVIKGTLQSDPSAFEYKWYICSGYDHAHTVISTEMNLDYDMKLPPDTYNFHLTVKEKSTGIEVDKTFYVYASNVATRGYLVLGDNLSTGRIGLDMISTPFDGDTIMVADVEDLSGLNLKSADKIIYSGYGLATWNQSLWLCADDKSYRLNSGSNFAPISEINDMTIFDFDYDVKKPYKLIDMFPHQSANINRSRSSRGYMTEDVIVCGSVIEYEYFTKPINRYSPNDKKLFKFFPCAFYRTTENNVVNYLSFYDMDNRSFCGFNYNAMDWNTYQTFNDRCFVYNDVEGDAWSWNTGSEGRSLVFGQNTIGANKYSYAIMKDDATDQLMIYRFIVPSLTVSNSASTGVTGKAGTGNKKLYTIDPSLAVDFDKASHYQFCDHRTSVVYSVGSRLYHYDFRGSGMVSHYDLDGEITCIKQDSPSNYDEIFVATYDSASKGKIYKVQIDSDPDDTKLNFLTGQQWSTSLKVKDIEWKYGNDLD